MDDLDILARDFGFRPLGKSGPMRSDGGDRHVRSSSLFVDDHNHGRDGLLFNDVVDGPSKYSGNSSNKHSSLSDFDYDSIFKSSGANDSKIKSTSSVPVYDKPVYDEDIFDGLPGLKSKSTYTTSYDDDVFASMASPPQKQRDHFDDLFGNLVRNEKVEHPKKSSSMRGLDDLLPGFGTDSLAKSNRANSESSQPPKPTGSSNQTTSTVMDNPFVVLESTSTPGVSSDGLFIDPLEEISKLSKSGSTKADDSSASGGVFDDIDPLNGFGKPVPAFSSETNNGEGKRSPSRTGSSVSGAPASAINESLGKSSFRYTEILSQKKMPIDDSEESHETIFDMPAASMGSQKSFGQSASSPSYNETNSQVDSSPRSEERVQPSDDVWLSVSEIPLFTQPTSAPPPFRPPPIPRQASKTERGSFTSNARKKGNEFSSSPRYTQDSQSSKHVRSAPKSPVVSPIDELEDFAMGRTWNNVDENADVHSGEEMNTNSAAAAAIKEAVDIAEAKFRHAKEVREREYAKASRSKEAVQLEKDEQALQEENQERLEHEQHQREREEQEREHRRLEKERERTREIEREKGRQAVERATREARERAAIEARERAAAETRLKSERAAVGRANAEARGRAERTAVQRVQTEARERAALEAKARAKKAAADAWERANIEARDILEKDKAAAARAEAEARRRAGGVSIERKSNEAEAEHWERANIEAREILDRKKAAVARAEDEARRRAERAAVDRAAAEARERAAAEARERVAASARMNQEKNDNDLESFFSMGSRPSSVPRPRANSSDPWLDPQFQSKGGPEGARRTSSSGGASSNMRKASSTTNIVDDLSSIFGAAPSEEFHEVEGESEERRRARLERQQRTHERATKALAEKNQRDLHTQREQEERNRIGETLDSEIKRWAVGKEGNLRALLSTLQYVLWPECGWQPVSLTDLILGASVKKAYRKATLCIHPDKVQQKGANLQQKYIAEKVF